MLTIGFDVELIAEAIIKILRISDQYGDINAELTMK
jgi:hypothetical protein